MSSSNALGTMRALMNEQNVISLKSGEVLFRPGETGSTMFGLLEGAIRITWIGQAGQSGHEDIPLGNVFGAGALVMEGHKRLGMATATMDCRLIEMTREKFLFALHETPMFALELLASIDQRLRDIKLANK